MSTLQLRLVPSLARTLKLQNGCRISSVYRLPQHKYKTKTTSFSPNYRKFNSIANNNNIYRQNSATTSLLLVSTQGANRWFRRNSHYDKWTNLCFEDMEALISCGDIQLFDVREPKEILDTGKIPCAINIPLGQIKEALLMADDLFLNTYGVVKPSLQDTNIVFVGLGPIKSSAALEIAHKAGFKKARHYYGGYKEWLTKTQTTQPPPPPPPPPTPK